MDKYLVLRTPVNNIPKKEETNTPDNIRKELDELKKLVLTLVKPKPKRKRITKNTKEFKTPAQSKGKAFVYTNPLMAKWLVKTHCDIKKTDFVLDACKGGGAFFDALPDGIKKDWCEIDLGKDFMEYKKKVDVCLSSPPLVPRKLFWDFMEKAMSISKRKIYWLMNMKSLNTFTPKRLETMEQNKWYIQKFTIVLDKRWFGRYCWVEIGREDKGFVKYNTHSY